MTEEDMSGAFKGPRKLCFSWPSKQRHLENTLKVKGNEKLDHVNCANIWTWTLDIFLEECLVDNHPTNNKCSLPLEDGHWTDIWNKLSILEAALIRKYDPLADSQSNIIPKPTTGIGIPLSILTDCCCFYSTRFTDRSFCVDSFNEFQADVGQAGNSSFLNASCWWDGFQNVFLSGSGMFKLKGRPL